MTNYHNHISLNSPSDFTQRNIQKIKEIRSYIDTLYWMIQQHAEERVKDNGSTDGEAKLIALTYNQIEVLRERINEMEKSV